MAALSGGHCAVDFPGGALPALLPFLVDKFNLSYTLAAVLVLASAIAGSIDPAALRALVGPPRRDLAAPDRGRDRRIGMALAPLPPELLARRALRRRLRARHRRLPPGGLEVRRVRERAPARERDVALLGRRQRRASASAPSRPTPLVLALGLSGGLLLAVPGLVAAAILLAVPLTCAVRPRAPDRRARTAAGETSRALRTAARRDHVPQPRLVRPAHVRPALGGLARPLEGARQPPALADAAGRRPRNARCGPDRRPGRPANRAARQQPRHLPADPRLRARRRRPGGARARARRDRRDRHRSGSRW